ncbi:hypothetical protein CCACVL1_04701 [Corchorus capsularis]|uniref:Uncharacterized protein n=1 Tax=Corchorus capsularis TaxID=210143 RepID=A0A1R3JQC0_COCAP|nr:hypothetical protein CCACVL1_04701 [Corchorus capsularis]
MGDFEKSRQGIGSGTIAPLPGVLDFIRPSVIDFIRTISNGALRGGLLTLQSKVLLGDLSNANLLFNWGQALQFFPRPSTSWDHTQNSKLDVLCLEDAPSPNYAEATVESDFQDDHLQETYSDTSKCLGSPCISIHYRSTEEINMILAKEMNYKEVFYEIGSNLDPFDSDVNDYEEVTSVELGLLDEPIAHIESPIDLAIVPSSNDCVRDNTFALDARSPSTPSSMQHFDCSDTFKDLNWNKHRKKKKRTKHNWSRKKKAL